MKLVWNFGVKGQISMETLERQYGWYISPATGLLPISFCKAGQVGRDVEICWLCRPRGLVTRVGLYSVGGSRGFHWLH